MLQRCLVFEGLDLIGWVLEALRYLLDEHIGLEAARSKSEGEQEVDKGMVECGQHIPIRSITNRAARC